MKDSYKQKSSLIREYEKKLRDYKTAENKTIDKLNKGIKLTKVSSSNIKSVPKIKKILEEKGDKVSRSRSKSKEVKNTSNLNRKVVKNLNIKPKKYNKSPNKYKNIPTEKSFETKKNLTN